MKRLALLTALLLVLGIAALFGTGWLLAHPVQVKVGPAPADLGARNASFTTARGNTIRGWWCPRDGSPGAVILLPGIRANRLSMVGRARFLRSRGYSVLLIDLQATGESEGEHITFGWRERDDVRAAVAYVRRMQPEARVGIVGSSLGGAAALLALPELEVDALVLESVYPSIDRATRNRLERRLGAIGARAASLLLSQLKPRLGVSASQLRPMDHIGEARCPVLVISGADDEHTTAADTRMLYEAAKPPKELWIVPKAKHVDLHRAAKGEYEKRVSEFLERSFQSARSRP